MQTVFVYIHVLPWASVARSLLLPVTQQRVWKERERAVGEEGGGERGGGRKRRGEEVEKERGGRKREERGGGGGKRYAMHV